jgi:hypothetical protein
VRHLGLFFSIVTVLFGLVALPGLADANYTLAHLDVETGLSSRNIQASSVITTPSPITSTITSSLNTEEPPDIEQTYSGIALNILNSLANYGWLWLCVLGIVTSGLLMWGEKPKKDQRSWWHFRIWLALILGFVSSLLGVAFIRESLAGFLMVVIGIFYIVSALAILFDSSLLKSSILSILPGVFTTFVLGLFILGAFLLPTLAGSTPIDQPNLHIVQEKIEANVLAQKLASERYCQKISNKDECVKSTKEAIIAFNRGVGAELFDKTLPYTVAVDAEILLPPTNVTATTYLVQPGDRLEEIAKCDTETLRNVDCQPTTVGNIIRANHARGLLKPDDQTIVAGQRIVRDPEAANTISLLGVQVDVGVFGLAAGLLAGLLILIFTGFLGGQAAQNKNILSSIYLSKKGGGHLSVSKFQMWLWTLVFIFAYTSVSIIRIIAGQATPLPFESFPLSLVILMGLSVGTYTLAYQFAQVKDKTSRPDLIGEAGQDIRYGTLIQGDDGQADITRFQLLAFTFVGVGFFAFRIVLQAKLNEHELAGINGNKRAKKEAQLGL